MSPGLVTILMFAFLVIVVILGTPLAFGLAAVGIIFTMWLWGMPALYVVVATTIATINNPLLVAVPLFILMGTVLQNSGLADALYTMVHRWAGRLPGALAIGTVTICVLIGAMSGITAAAAVSLGVIALPSMLKRGYSKFPAVGTIAGGSTLCIMIPPSLTLVLFGAMSTASIGQMFIAGVFPGLLLAGLFIVYLAIQARMHPEQMPALPAEERASWKEKFSSTTVAVPVIIIILGVLGSIFRGAATPTEAAGVGTILTIGMSALYRRFDWQLIRSSTTMAVKLTAMIMWILVGANVFSSVYQALGATRFINSALLGIQASSLITMWGILLVVLVLGMFIDPGAIIILVVPIAAPIIEALGINIIWFAILFNVALMIGYLSPPFGLVLFYMRAVCPPSVTTGDIYRSVVPFIVLEIVGMAILTAFPEITLWLPRLIMQAT